MKILLFGKTGQLGWELNRTLMTLGEVVAVDYPQIDFTNLDSLRRLVREVSPTVIINAAAYTAVDKAEDEQDLAYAINAMAPGALAEEANRLNAVLIHYSTDYVFDGEKGSAYLETDPPNPINVYGKSKLAGESLVQETGGSFLIFRTSWVYSLRRESFVTKVLAWAREHEVLRIVEDQVSSPTWCRVLAEITAQILAMGGKDVIPWVYARRGLYHLSGSGFTSRLKWAQAIIENDPKKNEQRVKEIQSASTLEFNTQAHRPLYTVLNCEKNLYKFGLCLPDWVPTLKKAIDIG